MKNETAQKVVTAIKSETARFVFGLLFVIFGVYMLLAFSSFFFTGGNDQSILSHPNPGELLETGNRIQNYAGARGAQLAEFLINDCFGISAYFIIVFLIVAGMKLIKAYDFVLWKWFAGCSVLMIWLSIALGFAFGGLLENSFLYPGGRHGYNVSEWICS
ncbi:MAG: DNA translocase FtsK 4TM domain-containing protein, partial [Bacteroides sp.]|nr:DNA translocase FtsK 4TM domain-containing protein [Bacteroides sp.]